jgi:hypothetical protein
MRRLSDCARLSSALVNAGTSSASVALVPLQASIPRKRAFAISTRSSTTVSRLRISRPERVSPSTNAKRSSVRTGRTGARGAASGSCLQAPPPG